RTLDDVLALVIALVLALVIVGVVRTTDTGNEPARLVGVCAGPRHVVDRFALAPGMVEECESLDADRAAAGDVVFHVRPDHVELALDQLGFGWLAPVGPERKRQTLRSMRTRCDSPSPPHLHVFAASTFLVATMQHRASEQRGKGAMID